MKVGIWGVESDDSGRSWVHPNALWNLVMMFKRYMGKLGPEANRFILIKLKGIPPFRIGLCLRLHCLFGNSPFRLRS